MIRVRHFLAAVAATALTACGTSDGDDENVAPPEELSLDDRADDTETLGIEDIEEVGPLTTSMEGVTPMNERVAVLGLLNKRNGQSRELRLRPGEQTRVGDVIVRVQACERTAPWESQRLTGAFVQLLVRQRERGGDDNTFRRVFSGWLFKERPALNVVEHRLYDVWPKDCEMTYPGNDAPAPSASENAASSAPRSAPPAPPAPAPEPEADDSSASSSTDA